MSRAIEQGPEQPRGFGNPSKAVRGPREQQPPLTQTHPLLEGFLKDIITYASTALDQIKKGEDPRNSVLRVASSGRMLERTSNVAIFNPDDDPAKTATEAFPFGR